MAMKDRMGAYLNDHLAGSAAGIELAERIRKQAEGTALGGFMNDVVAEIKADLATLEDLMGRLQIERNPVREAAGWIAEKVTRLRFTEQLTRSAHLSRLLELETLSLGVEGKKAMWQALKRVAELDAVLSQFDFDRMIGRAQSQLDGLEGQRQEAATRAFTP